MLRWAACLLPGRVAEMAALRLFPQIEVAEVGGAVWLRGATLDDVLDRELKKIPGLVRFELLERNRLRPLASRLADRTLPPVAWRPLRAAVAVALPVAALPGTSAQKAPLVLTRTSEEQPASALRTGIAEWHGFATTAAEVRLKSLRFAAMENREVFILGVPLPGLAGVRYVDSAGLFVPCGFTWSPPVAPPVLRQLFGVGPADLVVLADDNTHQIIRSEQFVPASRSAARNTLGEWADG